MWKVIRVLENHGIIKLSQDMPKRRQAVRICTEGHKYYKSTDCPTCPVCEKAIPMTGDLPKLAAPARRALEQARIPSLQKLSEYTKADLLALHGIGSKAIKILEDALEEQGLQFACH